MSPCRRFRFSLEPVLRVRSLREEQARLELALAVARLERARQALKDTKRLFARHLAALQDAAAQGISWQDYLSHTAYLSYLKDALQSWRSRLAQEEAETERQKLHLRHLHQERRLLSDLKERKFARFRREVDKAMEKETEAGVLQRWEYRDG